MKCSNTALAFWLILLAGAANAGEMICNFTIECFETEACAETDYTATVTYKVPADQAEAIDSRAQWSDVVGDRQARFSKGPVYSTANWSAVASGEWGRLLVTAESDARYLYTSAEGPLVITYHGTCEATD